jgi:hypothetical protein
VTLLSHIEIVKILARLYWSHSGPAGTPMTARWITATLDELDQRRTIGPSVAMTRQEIIQLREDLHGFCPQSPALALLSASGYWSRLAELSPLLTAADMQRALAVLWGDDAAISRLHRRLSHVLEGLGHDLGFCCPREALVETDAATGWIRPHAQSILAPLGVHAAVAEGDRPPLQIATLDGRVSSISRLDLAALVAEIEFVWPGARVGATAGADLIDFPCVPVVPDALAALDRARRQTADAIGDAALAALYGRAKTSFLFERASRRSEVTSLVASVVTGGQDQSGLGGVIADWIETAQGTDPHARERLRTGLFFIMAHASQAPQGPAADRVDTVDGTDQIGDILAEALGERPDWIREWTPDRQFRNVFSFDDLPVTGGERPADGGTPGETGFGAARRRATATHSGPTPIRPRAAESLAPAARRDSMEQLLDVLAMASDASSKRHQIATQLTAMRRRLRSRLLRHHVSNDPMHIAEWRRQVGNVLQSRVQHCAQVERFGLLQSTLLVSQDELAALLSRVLDKESAAAADGAGQDDMVAEMALASQCAIEVVCYWGEAVRLRGRAQRLCRDLQVPPSIVQHLIDELAIGATRTSLAARLASAFTRSQALSPRAGASPPRLSAIAVRLIADHVELFNDAPQVTGSAAIASAWERGLHALIDENIRSMRLLASTADQDRVLGQVLTSLAQTSFDVGL